MFAPHYIQGPICFLFKGRCIFLWGCLTCSFNIFWFYIYHAQFNRICCLHCLTPGLILVTLCISAKHGKPGDLGVVSQPVWVDCEPLLDNEHFPCQCK